LKEDLNSAINSIKSEFGKLGIDLSFGFIKYSLVTKHADTVNKIAMSGNQYAQELIKFIDIFSDVIPLQTYESLIEGEDKDMFKVLKELNAKSDLRGKDATGEAATAGFFAKNVVDGEEAADTGAETRLKQLAENNAIFDESVGESTFQNAENKTVFDKVFPSYITQAITSLKENVLTQSDLNDVLSLKEAYRVRGTILSDYQAGVLLQVLQNNPLLKGLTYNSKSGFSEDSEVTDFIFNNMQVFIMDGLKQESLDEDSFGGTQEQGKTYKDLDKRAKALMMLSMFADTTQKFSKKELKGFNPEGTRLFILGTNEAKSTTVGVNLPVQNFYANGSLTELGLAYFNSTFKQEYERIQKIVKELKVLQDKLNNNEPLVNYSHSYHGEIPFIRSIQFNDEGNIINWDSLEKVPRGLKFFQFAKMQNIALLNKQAVEGASLPEVNGELQNFAKSQLSDYLEMLSKSDVDILKKVQETIQTKGEKQIRFTEETSSGYRERTIKNASADATIALATDFNTGGEILTKNSVLNQNKKYIPIDTNKLEVTNELIKSIVDNLNEVNAKTLNIAGNGIYTMKNKYTQKQIDDFTYELLNKVLNSKDLNTKIVSIRSGGQTGFDEAGAKAGFKLGLSTLIHAPKGFIFRTKEGKDISSEKEFKARFGIELSDKLDLFNQKEIKTTYNIKQLPSYYKKESSDEVDENKIGQYFFNHYFNTTAFNFMLHGDYAMNYKDSVDVVKRNGGLIAFGPET
jgi:succinate dehydrogenase flavin-adding protein (antitoxin of CptAB toxin-antitoxin module)